ncbi:CYTH and CHAD domain-containing protein [Sinomonas notoginsengisoli]|uniref:CYTH and CHAD domain-containing protein n=1 Tax=Sinomonas notoginsengisoli TaxID=1457311 RepID=UPI001F1C118D|nr:CYTH and CHAD domain-containing protein [Sinomonas notoginsengisoli]
MAGHDSLEVERKYTVDDGMTVPSLSDLPGVDRVSPSGIHRLEAMYFDTPQLALAAHGITLRRRTGGPDAGWHLKLPAGKGARHEVTEPLGVDPTVVPARLKGLVTIYVRDAELVPAARVSTRRATAHLLSESGRVLAEFSDDRVESQAPPGLGPLQKWREWEIELEKGSEDLLSAADELLAESGVHPATLPSKLAQALGPSLPQKEPVEAPTRKGEAGVVLLAYMHQQLEALKAEDPGVRLDAPDAVHQLRVAGRRMRSALATFRKLVDADTANRLREELAWLGGTVGQARDVEVMRERLEALVAAEPPGVLTSAATGRIERESASRYRQAHDVGLAALDGERYFRLLDSLEAFLADPPLADQGRKKASKTIARRIEKDIERLRAAVRAAHEVEDAETGDEATLDAALHEVRKKAKRLRYAAEAATPVLGKRASKLAAAAEQIQDTLGALQDSVVIREHLRDLAAQAEADGESTFSFGRLHALEQQRAAEARAHFARDWADFTKEQS